MSEQKDNIIEIEINDANGSGDAESEKDAATTQGGEKEAQAEISDCENASKESSSEEVVAAEYMNQMLRAQAELQNYKRRTEQRMQQWRDNASRDIVTKLLPVVDDFDILFDHHQNEDETVAVKGVEMIYNKLMAILSDLGLESIEAEGQTFDPNVHEAIMAEESEEVEEGKILKVWQRGFRYGDSLMRPAKVITAIAKRNSGEKNE